MRNDRKIHVLRALAAAGWLKPRQLHDKAAFPFTTSPWSYLARLQRWGLVRKRIVDGIGLEYSVTKRGRERLEWLLSRHEEN